VGLAAYSVRLSVPAEMAGSGKPTPSSQGAPSSGRPVPPGTPRPQATPPQRRPPQVLMIKKDEPRREDASEPPAALQAPTPSGPVASPAPEAPSPQR